jgi:hypothetical protein
MRRVTGLLFVVAGIILLASPLYAGETKAGGEVFAYWNLHLNDQGKVVGDLGRVKSYSQFNISRAFIDMSHTFNDKYSARVTGDIYETPDANNWDLRVVYAYLQINNLMPHIAGRFGLQQLVWADRVDQVWGLRYVDEASMEKLGYINFADFGASLYGVCPGGWGELVLQAFNGGGYTEPEVNKYKDLVAYATFTPLGKYPEFKECALWFQYYKGWPNLEPVQGVSFSKNTKKDRISGAAVIKYRNWFTAYADYFIAKDDTNPSAAAIVTITGIDLPEDDKSTSFTVFGKSNVATSETFLSNVFIFGKFQWLNKHTDYNATGLKLYADEGDGKFLTAGAGYTLTDGFEVAITFLRSTVNRIEYDVNMVPLRIAETEKNSLLLNMKAVF